MENFLLDYHGDALIPGGYVLIEDEVGFLRIVDGEGKWFIRGQRLCEWARTFLRGRHLRFQDAPSPRREILTAIPDLSEDQADALYSRLESKYFSLRRPISAPGILQALHPDFRWAGTPSLEHAAEWLLWLDLQTPDQVEQPLLRAVSEGWQRDASRSLKPLYEATDSESAQSMLDIWLGIKADQRIDGLEEFPVKVPAPWSDRALSAWRHSMVDTHGDFFEQLMALPLSPELKQIAVGVAFDYFTVNPQQLTEGYLATLAPGVSGSQWEQLRGLLRPPEPSDVPEAPAEVLAWFRNEYLPLREWQQGDDRNIQVRHRIVDLARCFATWYLDFYRRALNSKDKEHLSFRETGFLRGQDTEFVTLLIVLDGLHLPDARQFLRALQVATRRLEIQEDRLVFAPIPTITRFAKEALLKGVPELHAAGLPPLAVDISERKSPNELLQTAHIDDLFIWRIQEPDHTYHARNNYDSLKHEVEGQLNTVAQKIAELVEQLPVTIPLKLVLTTDHGRLLASSQRSIPIPAGMETHGRAASGPASEVKREFPAAGYTIEDNVVYLHGESYGLTEDAAVILDEAAFRMNDGKQGQEWYTHGGLFPEEVIVPWIVLVRDAMPKEQRIPMVEVRITGKNRAGQAGTLHVEIINSDEIPIVLNSVEIEFGVKRSSETLQCGWEILALTKQNKTLELRFWPSKEEIKHSKATAYLRWPSGERVEIRVSMELESEELYSRDTSLLDGLEL